MGQKIRIKSSKPRDTQQDLWVPIPLGVLLTDPPMSASSQARRSVIFSMSFGDYFTKLMGAKEVTNCAAAPFSSRLSSIVELGLCRH